MSGVERLTPSAARTRQSWETLATPRPATSGGGPKSKALEDDKAIEPYAACMLTLPACGWMECTDRTISLIMSKRLIVKSS